MKTCKLTTFVIAAAVVAASLSPAGALRAQEAPQDGEQGHAQAQDEQGHAQAQDMHSGHGPHSASELNPEDRHGVFGIGHDYLHHWYETLKQPGSGMSCCNNQDCRPTSSRVVGNEVQVEVDGEWTPVPPDKILKVQPPDLGAHVCAPKASSLYPKGYIFCVVLGNGV